MSQQEDVVGSKAEGEDQKNDGGQTYRPLLLDRFGISGQLADDVDVAECRDTEGEEKKDENHAEEEGCPRRHGREHVFLQHVKACGDPEFRDVKGQVCGHQRVEDAQHQTPHQEAAEDRKELALSGLSEQHGPDDAQVAINTDGHHRQDRTVHVGVESEGQDAGGRTHTRELLLLESASYLMAKLCLKL